ncbi:Zn(2)-C6 fungal-type domain-containing protein [Trichoderma simmonsii]|uniref:Zn(2)-C6 fungal-type domain-containing protein n=1 Tax=Trichoderma simmonsii TaxID=1491479 RepID=A0A8G0L6Q9_9HYPO|nr:Zn(2)-C6 fungal-type domain-containing protein [Trichoderma simmonsii]
MASRIYNKDSEEQRMTISPLRILNGDEVPKQSDGPNPHSSSLIAISSTNTMSNTTCESVLDTEEEAEAEADINNLKANRRLQTSQETQPFNMPWPQADEILHVFQQKYVHHFPFVILESGISARQLEQRQPFTLKAIIIIATPLPWLITATMKDSFFAHLGQRLFTEKDFDMDLLQCILLCIAWADICDLSNHQITNLTHVALGYAHNLAASGRSFNASRPESGAIDAHRAFLGCVSVLSADSVRFGRQSPLSGPYVDICRSLLRQHPECPTDFVLERYVRLMQLNDEISERFNTNTHHDGTGAYLTLVKETAQRLRPELDSIMGSLGFDQQQYRWPSIGNVGSHEKSFRLAYNYLLVRLYEPVTRFEPATMEAEDAPLGLWHLCLTSCISATKAFLESLLATRPDGWYAYQSAIATRPIIFVMILAARLHLIKIPGWNAKLTYPEFDLSSIIDRFVSHLEEAEETLEQDIEKFAYSTKTNSKPAEMMKSKRLTELAKKAKRVKELYEAERSRVVTNEPFSDGTRGPTIIAENEKSAGDIWWPRQPQWFNGLYENWAWNFDDIGS